MISNGWPYDLALYWGENGHILFKDISKVTTPSKKLVKLNCSSCLKVKFSQHRSIVGRKYLAGMSICSDCASPSTSRLDESRLVNSVAQKIAQNKPEQKALNSASVRFSPRGLKKHYDEYYITASYRRLFHVLYDRECQLCFKGSFLVHHINKGGQSSPENLIPLCNSCHTGIHNFDHIPKKWDVVTNKLKKTAGDKIEDAKQKESESYKAIQLFWKSA